MEHFAVIFEMVASGEDQRQAERQTFPGQPSEMSTGADMQLSATKILFNYWNNLRGSRSAPERRNVDPTKIRTALSNTFILEADQAQGFSFRLAGSHLCSAYCRELKARPYLNLWHLKDRDAVATLIKAVTDDHAVALVNFEGTTATAKKISFETILLPLRHNGASNIRILGSMASQDEPYWFGAQPILEQRITGLRLIWPDDQGLQGVFGDLGSPFVPEIGTGPLGAATSVPATVHGINARRYAHLAVIDGGRN